MTDCNAKVTTATETDDVVAELDRPASVDTYEPCFWDDDIPDGVAVIRRGDRLLRLDLHTLMCSQSRPCEMPLSHCATVDVDEVTGERQAMWWDHTPGATPHREADR